MTQRGPRGTFRDFGSGHDCGCLFDPLTMPHMAARADAVMHHIQTSHEIEYVDRRPPGTPPYDPDDPQHQAVVEGGAA